MNGIHYLCDFNECKCEREKLLDAKKVIKDIRQFVHKSKLTTCDTTYFKFENGGFSGSIILAESHINFHTWPETNTVNLDIYVCNYIHDNSNKAKTLYEYIKSYFDPINAVTQIIGRPSNDFVKWGYHLALDMYHCNDKVKSKEAIVEYTTKLCDVIDMKRYGECVAVHFGDDPRVSGYSSFQLIETSCISAHWVDIDNSAHIDIFSCKKYNINDAIEFTKNFFEYKDIKYSYIER